MKSKTGREGERERETPVRELARGGRLARTPSGCVEEERRRTLKPSNPSHNRGEGRAKSRWGRKMTLMPGRKRERAKMGSGQRVIMLPGSALGSCCCCTAGSPSEILLQQILSFPPTHGLSPIHQLLAFLSTDSLSTPVPSTAV